MMMGQNPMNLQYSVTNQVFRSPTSVPTEVQVNFGYF